MPTGVTKKCVGLTTSGNRYDVPDGSLVQASNVLVRNNGEIIPRWSTLVSSGMSSNISYVQCAQAYKDFLFSCQAGLTPNENQTSLDISNFSSAAGGFNLSYRNPDNGTTAAAVTFFNELLQANNCLYFNAFEGVYRISDGVYGPVAAGGLECAVSTQPRPFRLEAGKVTRLGNDVTVQWPCNPGFSVGMTVEIVASADVVFPVGTFVITSIPVSPAFQFVYNDPGADAVSTDFIVFAAAQFVGSNGFAATDDKMAYRAVLTSYDANGTSYLGPVSGRALLQNAAPYIGTANNKNVQLAVLFKRPAATDIAPWQQNVKLEVYRSQNGHVAVGGVVVPANDELLKVYEKYLTETERNQGYAWITDQCPGAAGNDIRGQALYTNESVAGKVGVGINNNRPPCAKTTALFKEQLALGNTNDFGKIEVQLISTVAANGGLAVTHNIGFWSDYDGFTPGDYTSERDVYTAVDTTTNMVAAGQFILTTGGLLSSDVQETVMSLVDSINWNNNSGDIYPLENYRAEYNSIAGVLLGAFDLFRTDTDFYEPDSNNYKARFVYSTSTSRGAWGPKLAALFPAIAGNVDRVSNVVTVTTTGTPTFEVGEWVTVYDQDGITPLSLAGVVVQGEVLTNNGTAITFANTGTDAVNTNPAFVASSYRPLFDSDRKPNRVHISKRKQYEAFAPFATVDVGSPNTRILKLAQCQDALLVFKDEGLYRVLQSEEGVLSAELLSAGAVLVAKESVQKLKDQVLAWFKKGVAIIGPTGIESYISAPIDNALLPYSIASESGGFKHSFGYAHENEDSYELRIKPGFDSNQGISVLNFVYNASTKSWTQDTLNASAEFLYGSEGFRYIYATDSALSSYYALYKQGSGAGVGVAAFAFDANPGIDILSVTAVGGDYYDVVTSAGIGAGSGVPWRVGSFFVPTAGGGWVTRVTDQTHLRLYAPVTAVSAPPIVESTVDLVHVVPIISTVEWAPVTAVQEGSGKAFQEIEILFGRAGAVAPSVAFRNEVEPTTDTVVCPPLAVSQNSALVNTDFKPGNLRIDVPAGKRRCQQLSVVITLATAELFVSLLGLAATWRVTSSKVSR